jgi:predicted amidohydrolase YtcJ
MRSATNLGITLLVVFSSRAASQVSITHVSVVDVERGTVQTDRTVVIEDDRIRAITTGAPAGASGTRTIDARGAYMIPGLWYMHVHLGMAGRSALALLVANGVTGVRDMGGKFDLVRSWRDISRQASLEHELLGFANDRWVLSLDEMTPADRAALYARLVAITRCSYRRSSRAQASAACRTVSPSPRSTGRARPLIRGTATSTRCSRNTGAGRWR